MTTAQSSARWPKIFAGVVAVVAVALAGRAHADPRFAEAHQALVEGRYAAAVTDFEALAQARGWSEPLLYQLGNAYAAERRVGPAVLSYERARWLSPRDAEVAAGLASVRANSGLPVRNPPWYERWSRILTSTDWTMLAAGGLWLGCVAFALAWERRSRRFTSLAALLILIGAASLGATAVLDRSLDDAVVVAEKGTSLRLSPFDSAAAEANLAEGDEVAVIGLHGGFVRVRDGMGHAGWVESAAVKLIVPRSS